MTYYLIKIILTAALIVLVSEIGKRSSLAAAILASIPLVSVLAMVWLYHDTHDVRKISDLATSIFWLVLPSLALFVTLPVLLKYGMNFYTSLGIAIAATVACYWGMVLVLNHFGVRL